MESEEDVAHKGSRLILSKCAEEYNRQSFYHTDKNELVLAQLLCLEAMERRPRITKCHEMGGAQEWKISRQVRQF